MEKAMLCLLLKKGKRWASKGQEGKKGNGANIRTPVFSIGSQQDRL